jgi:osmoprotectant transport system permease protein
MNDEPYLLDPGNWDWGVAGSIPHRILEHLEFTAITLVIAAAIAIPIGLFIGHTNKGAFLAINIGNAGRSLPTFGLLSLIVTLVGLGQLPLILALVVLAVPPILTTTYAGLRAVDPAAVDSARGMGMRPLQIIFRAEVPIALPLILGGLRSAALQVVATATVAAYVGLGGLGRLLVDGLSLNLYDRVLAGAVLVASLAIVIDLFGALVQRLVVSPGVTGRGLTGGTMRGTTTSTSDGTRSSS